MSLIVNPKVNIISRGPSIEHEGYVITPDEFVYGAANITYKDVGALQEFMELKKSDADLGEKVNNMLITVAGAGHASMATTPGFWIFLEGTCSKLVDSMFTTARFGSSLMPSGRRIPISIDQIVVPQGIHKMGIEEEWLYLKTSERNIRLYEELQERKIPKQEASKIVQYGHRGGGFMFMPLETLIYFSKLMEEDLEAFPREGGEIISQIEDKMREMGMNTIYQARKNAPRTGAINPEIFHFRQNLAHEIVESEDCVSPYLVSMTHIPSKERDQRIRDWEKIRTILSKSPKKFEDIGEDWMFLLTELDQIVRDYNDSVSLTTATLTPWRVWGEVKRHRTLPQTAESVYHAVQRASRELEEMGEEIDVSKLKRVVSLPGTVRKDKEALRMWFEAFRDSINTYNRLVEGGAPQSDAIMVVPRGIKLGVVKNFDLYNLTLGYASLRLCNTAEPEMRRITEQERRLVEKSDLPREIKGLVIPKCGYTLFCPERKKCERILPFIDPYEDEFHAEIQKSVKERIRRKI